VNRAGPWVLATIDDVGSVEQLDDLE